MRSKLSCDQAEAAVGRASHTPSLATDNAGSTIRSEMVESLPAQGTAIIENLGGLQFSRSRPALVRTVVVLGMWLPLLALIALLTASAQQRATVTAVPPATEGIVDQSKTGKPYTRAADDRPAIVDLTDKIFPHVAFGGGWETSMTLVNLSATSLKPTLRFYDQSGAPMTVTLLVIPDDVQVTGSGFDVTFGPNQTISFLLRDVGQDLRIGWSNISYDATNSRIGGYAIFRQKVQDRPDFEAVVPLSSFYHYVFVIPFDNLGGFVTSMALLNPVDYPIRVSATVLDHNAIKLEISDITLAPRNQIAFSIPDRFPSTQNRIGTIRFSGNTSGLSALGLRFNPGGAFATIPVLNWSGMYSSQQPTPVYPFRDYEITIKPTLTIDGNQVSPRIMTSYPLADNAEVNTTGVAYDPSSKIILMAYFDKASYTATSVTYEAWQGYYTNLNPGTPGSGSIVSGTLTLTAASPNVGTTVTGNLQFATASRSFNVNFTTTITSSQRIQ